MLAQPEHSKTHPTIQTVAPCTLCRFRILHLQLCQRLLNPPVNPLPNSPRLLLPLCALLLTTLPTDSLLLPPNPRNPTQRLHRPTQPAVRQRRPDHEVHPCLREHVRARHVSRRRDGEQDGRKVRDEARLQRTAGRRGVRGKRGVWRCAVAIEVRGRRDRVEEAFLGLLRKPLGQRREGNKGRGQ